MSTASTPLLQASWQRSWSALGLLPPEELQQQLLAAYAGPQRHYHTRQHLAECLTHLDTCRPLAQHPGEVELALWFHDAIYDVKRKDNEQRSAQWAEQALRAANTTYPRSVHR